VLTYFVSITLEASVLIKRLNQCLEPTRTEPE